VLFVVDKVPWPASTGARLRISRLWEAFEPGHRHLVLACAVSNEDQLGLREHAGAEFSVLAGTPSPKLGGRLVQMAQELDCGAVWASGPWVGACGWPVDAVVRLVVDAPSLAYRQLTAELASHVRMLGTQGEARSLVYKLLSARSVLARERRAWRNADLVTPCSAHEQAQLPPAVRERSAVVPNGCDVPPLREAQPAEPRLIFVGTLHYPPNAEAAVALVEKILPFLRRRYPALILDIVGVTPKPLRERLERQEGVELHGFVDDLGPLYARASHAVAPLRAHTGTNVKILEAVAHGVPVVTTPPGIEGLSALNAGNHVAIGRDWRECCDRAAELLEDPGRSRAMAVRAWTAVQEHLSWVRSQEALRRAMAALSGWPLRGRGA
jgi:glycosyltransferase involved in cell wall biosynthesis